MMRKQCGPRAEEDRAAVPRGRAEGRRVVGGRRCLGGPRVSPAPRRVSPGRAEARRLAASAGFTWNEQKGAGPRGTWQSFAPPHEPARNSGVELGRGGVAEI